MRRIKMVLSVGVMMVALLALTAGSAMASEIEDFEIDGDEVEIALVGGGNLEFEDLDGEDLDGFGVLDFDDFDDDDDDDDDDDNDDDNNNDDNDQESVSFIG